MSKLAAVPSPDRIPRTRGVVLRGIGFGLAVALGAVAVWLIVTSMTQKRLELGVLAGLWGLLLGAFSMFGSRRTAGDEDADAATSTGAVAHIGAVLERRSKATQVEHAAEVAARRAHEARIEEILRQEIRNAVNREVGTLRAEIAQLRTELLEKVGGQLRLEHIETTRVIGSDLEVLQDEIRALKTVARPPAIDARVFRDLGRAHQRPADVTRTVTAAKTEHHAGPSGRVVEVEASIVQSAVIDSRSSENNPTQDAVAAAPPAESPTAGPDETAQRPLPQSPAPEHAGAGANRSPTSEPVSGVAPSSKVTPESEGEDVFAGLPRLSRFVEDSASEESAGPSTAAPTPAAPTAPVAPAASNDPTYSGRRRRADEDVADSAGPEPARAAGGGRRRRVGDGEDDLLARLLTREQH